MRVVRLYDPAREPQSWMQIIRPTEFAAFATRVDSGVACDAAGAATSADDATCMIFETLPAAEAFCRAQVDRHPNVRFEILDSAGRRRLPILTVVHTSHGETLDGTPKKMRWNRNMAAAMLVAGPTLIWFDWHFYDGLIILPTVVGINLVLIGARLLIMNRGHVAAERARQARVEQALQDATTSSPRDA